MNAEQMRLKLQELKNEAQSLLDSNNMQEAESKTWEAKLLSAQIEIQDKLDVANAELETLKDDIATKEESITNLTSELETIKSEKTEIMEKYNTTTEKVTELTSKITAMQPIVDKFNEDQKTQRLNSAVNSYKARFEKVGGLEVFESEEVQNLISDTINEDESVSVKAKCALSDKINEILDNQENINLPIDKIQEKTKETKNLNVENDEFESVYGFKKQ